MIKKRIISCIISAAMLICMTATMPFSASAEIVEIFKDDFEKMWTEMNEYSTFLRNSATAYRNTQEDAKTRAQNLKGNYNG